MASLTRLGADELRAVVLTYRDALRAHQAGINRLNVYPVPDGDTGTNMALTLDAVVRGARRRADRDLPDVCTAISHGALMGGRGNSGVILVPDPAGRGPGHRPRPTASTAPSAAAALAAASAGRYQAVGDPVEGTILTVVREASEAAAAGRGRRRPRRGAEAALAQGADALARTPDMLPVLAEAGVVDAGGTGFLLLLDVAAARRRRPRRPRGRDEVDGPDLEALAGHGATGTPRRTSPTCATR